VYDLTSAYYHIKIDDSQHQFLGAAIENNDGSKLYFQYNHLPFGLNSAVHAITKMWKPVTQYLTSQGLRNTIYIDDGRILVEDQTKAEEARCLVYNTIAQAGWSIEREKSDKKGEAGTVKKYLGFLIDSKNMTITATEDKLEKVEEKLKQVLSANQVRIKDLAGLLGLIVSLEHSHDFLARLATRSGYATIADHTQSFGWMGKTTLNKETQEELCFFRDNMKIGNGAMIKTAQLDIRVESILEKPVANRQDLKNHKSCDEILVSDASDRKAVVYDLLNDSKMEMSYTFTSEEQNWSSAAREALAVLRTLEQFKAKKITKKSIYWITDSEVMALVLKKGSHRQMLQKIVFQIATLCHHLQIRIEPIHLRRQDPRIQMADDLSKHKDTDNWSVDDISFQELNEQFGFEIDLFADRINRKTQKFFSLYFDKDSSGIDAFSMSWEKVGMIWACPPVGELIRVHQRIISSNCKGVIVMPKWLTSSYIHNFLKANAEPRSPYKLIKEWHPYIVQNEGAVNTALMGITTFPFLALAFNL